LHRSLLNSEVFVHLTCLVYQSFSLTYLVHQHVLSFSHTGPMHHLKYQFKMLSDNGPVVT